MAGVRCIKPGCGFETLVPEKDKNKLMAPSAQVTCPKCHLKQPAADAFVCFEARQAELRRGLSVTSAGPSLTFSLSLPGPHWPKNGKHG